MALFGFCWEWMDIVFGMRKAMGQGEGVLGEAWVWSASRFVTQMRRRLRSSPRLWGEDLGILLEKGFQGAWTGTMLRIRRPGNMKVLTETKSLWAAGFGDSSFPIVRFRFCFQAPDCTDSPPCFRLKVED